MVFRFSYCLILEKDFFIWIFQYLIQFRKALIQFRGERQAHHPKRWFFFKNRSIHFPINSISVIQPSNETSWVLQTLKSTSHCLPQSTVSCRSDSNSEANNSSCCHKPPSQKNKPSLNWEKPRFPVF